MDESERLAGEWQRLCLRRVSRFAQLAHNPSIQTIPQLLHLSRASVLSAYRDCVALGLGEEARRVIAEFQQPLESTPGA